MASLSISCPDVGDSPNQPRNISFPKVSFGKAKPVYRSFNVGWFDKWPWLHWDVATERAYCHTCVLAYTQNKLRSLCADPAFISRGYQNWKDATAALGPMRPLPVIKSRYKKSLRFQLQPEM